DGALALAPEVAANVSGLRPGTAIGPFRVVRRLGGGGMGTVYEAEQDSPRRTVALKVLRLDQAGPDAALRFRAEAEFLGRLRHPSVAQVHAAGVHRLADGTDVPWIALEFVP